MDSRKQITDSWQLLSTLNDMANDETSFSIEQLIEVAEANAAFMDYACCDVLLSQLIDPNSIKFKIDSYKKILEISKPFYHDLLPSARYRYEVIESIIETL